MYIQFIPVPFISAYDISPYIDAAGLNLGYTGAYILAPFANDNFEIYPTGFRIFFSGSGYWAGSGYTNQVSRYYIDGFEFDPTGVVQFSFISSGTLYSGYSTLNVGDIVTLFPVSYYNVDDFGSYPTGVVQYCALSSGMTYSGYIAFLDNKTGCLNPLTEYSSDSFSSYPTGAINQVVFFSGGQYTTGYLTGSLNTGNLTSTYFSGTASGYYSGNILGGYLVGGVTYTPDGENPLVVNTTNYGNSWSFNPVSNISQILPSPIGAAISNKTNRLGYRMYSTGEILNLGTVEMRLRLLFNNDTKVLDNTPYANIGTAFNGVNTVPIFSLGNNTALTGNTNIADKQYHMVSCTFNGTNARIFVDGILDTAGVISGAGFFNSAANGSGLTHTPAFYIGAVSGTFYGEINEFRVWNYIRSDAQIAANYNQIINADLETGLGILMRV